MKTRFILILFVMIAILLPNFTAAQSTDATLTGRVADSSKAMISNVRVTAINTGTNVKYETATNESGIFTLSHLPPGPYRLEIEKLGFKTIVETGILLHVQDTVQLNYEMALGAATESVTVKANGNNINTTNGAVATVVDRQFVENMPMNGRSFQTLIELTPGVVPTGTAGGGAFAVNGQRLDSNNFMVDGVSANFGSTATGSQINGIGTNFASGTTAGLASQGTTQTLASVDAMEEFRVQTSTYSAEYGRQPGGQISIVTRSGTNQFHGTLFDYLRNTVFDANNWFANSTSQPRPPEHQNDFGGVLGGPLRIPGLYNGKDRTFFFFSYEGLRLALPTFTTANVPTVALRQAAPASLQPILNAFPLPNGTNLGNGMADFNASYSNRNTLNATSVRIDHAINNKWTLFGRYNYAPSYAANRLTYEPAVISYLPESTWTATVGLTGVLSPALTNDLRFNYSSSSVHEPSIGDTFGGAVPQGVSALMPSQYITNGSLASLLFTFPGNSVSTVDWTAGNPISAVATQAQYNVVDSVSYLRGSHQFKFGVDYRHLAPTQISAITNLFGTFTSQTQVMNGILPTATAASTAITEPTFVNFSLYAQDSWKVTRRLTVDLGLRWDVNPAPGAANGLYPIAVNEVSNFATMSLLPNGTPMWKTTYNNFGPRLGAAYQIGRNPGHETVLRGGFGVFYDTDDGIASRGLGAGFPVTVSTALTNVAFPINPAVVAPPAQVNINNLKPPYGTVFAFDPNLKLPYTLEWNVAVEQAFGTNQALTVSYVASNGRRLLINQQYTISSLNPSFTGADVTTNRATSSYNSLQTQFQRRLSHGLQGILSYTWSHAIDTTSADSFSMFPPIRGNADFDIRQMLAGALVYNTPKLSNRIAETILGNWSLDNGIHFESALPLNVTTSQVLNPLTGTFTITFPDVISGVPLYLYGSQYPGGRIINNTAPTAAQVASAGCQPVTSTTPAKGALCTPPTGTNGDLGRNVLRGLPAWQLDSAVERRFKLTERLSLAFRAEAFNVFNHPDFGPPNKTLTASTFGQSTNTLNVAMSNLSALYQIGGPRSMQFSLKLRF